MSTNCFSATSSSLLSATTTGRIRKKERNAFSVSSKRPDWKHFRPIFTSCEACWMRYTAIGSALVPEARCSGV